MFSEEQRPGRSIRNPPAGVLAACLYGRSAAPFVGRIADDIREVASRRRGDVRLLTIEECISQRQLCRSVSRLYVLPFDVPTDIPQELPPTAAALVPALFPLAEMLNPLAAHELVCDRVAMARRLLNRGVPMPDTLVTDDPADARAFVREHEYAVLKASRSFGAQGHLVVYLDESGDLVGEAVGRRYKLSLDPSCVRRRLESGVLSLMPPFYLQCLVVRGGRGRRMQPAQVLRAYIADGQVAFWAECYRDTYRCMGDFLTSVVLGARYRFLREASEEARKIALRAAEVLGVRFAGVDLVRTDTQGPFVLGVVSDGPRSYIDRGFKDLPEFRPAYDFDALIVDSLIAPDEPSMARGFRAARGSAPRARR